MEQGERRCICQSEAGLRGGTRERKGEEGEGTVLPFTLAAFGSRISCFFFLGKRSFPLEGWSETKPGEQEHSEHWSRLKPETLKELRLDDKEEQGSNAGNKLG